jgi:hypothetical protein
LGKMLYLWLISQDKGFENFERKNLVDKGI